MSFDFFRSCGPCQTESRSINATGTQLTDPAAQLAQLQLLIAFVNAFDFEYWDNLYVYNQIYNPPTINHGVVFLQVANIVNPNLNGPPYGPVQVFPNGQVLSGSYTFTGIQYNNDGTLNRTYAPPEAQRAQVRTRAPDYAITNEGVSFNQGTGFLYPPPPETCFRHPGIGACPTSFYIIDIPAGLQVGTADPNPPPIAITDDNLYTNVVLNEPPFHWFAPGADVGFNLCGPPLDDILDTAP